MNVRQQMHIISKERKKTAKLNQTIYNDRSRERLLKIVYKKLQTTFIGALSQFEQTFGKLWGYNKAEFELTEQEALMFELWNKVRTNILNNGNNQFRALENELAEYTVTWNRHSIELLPIEKKEEKTDEKAERNL